MRRYLALIVTLLFFYSWVGALEDKKTYKYVKNFEKFYVHMDNHVANVHKLGIDLLQTIQANPKKYNSIFNIPPGADLQRLHPLLSQMLTLHDQSKLNISANFLTEHNIGQRPIIYDLYDIYGKNQLSEKDKKLVGKTVNKLNRVDQEVMDNFISQARKQHKLTAWEENLLHDIEKMSDLVERGQNPVTVEEMGRPVSPGSDFVKGRMPEDQRQVMIQLEKRYSQIASSLEDHQKYFLQTKGRVKIQGTNIGLYLQEYYPSTAKPIEVTPSISSSVSSLASCAKQSILRILIPATGK
ncbi:MAG: hypothetical protein HN353_11450 [Bdellovibrionales bacterium]|jgi:hypothetical protein|nr:hypothetical protein [Bdellovibrionales bacterium]MBT3525729.1 hypothetical protein [Bdellovibrionales bacterium]MBT7669670.1 hypothetical protein [Bdellovibrionales bacterium]